MLISRIQRDAGNFPLWLLLHVDIITSNHFCRFISCTFRLPISCTPLNHPQQPGLTQGRLGPWIQAVDANCPTLPSAASAEIQIHLTRQHVSSLQMSSINDTMSTAASDFYSWMPGVYPDVVALPQGWTCLFWDDSPRIIRLVFWVTTTLTILFWSHKSKRQHTVVLVCTVQQGELVYLYHSWTSINLLTNIAFLKLIFSKALCQWTSEKLLVWNNYGR